MHTTPLTGLSLTNSTESGTVYRATELAALGTIARARGMRVHMDGARFANAVAASGSSPAELTWRAGIEVLSLGATKVGAVGAEAVITFDPSLGETIERHRKRFGHLLSKQRLAAAQFLGWLEGGAWLERAAHANAMASRLGSGLRENGWTPDFDVETNMVFLTMTPTQADKLAAAGAAFYTNSVGDGLLQARFVASWSSQPDEVDQLVSAAAGIVDVP